MRSLLLKLLSLMFQFGWSIKVKKFSSVFIQSIYANYILYSVSTPMLCPSKFKALVFFKRKSLLIWHEELRRRSTYRMQKPIDFTPESAFERGENVSRGAVLLLPDSLGQSLVFFFLHLAEAKQGPLWTGGGWGVHHAGGVRLPKKVGRPCAFGCREGGVNRD